MTLEQLDVLLDQMCHRDDGSLGTISERGYAQAETVTDVSLIPRLAELVAANSASTLAARRIRRAAYFIWGKLLKISFDAEYGPLFFRCMVEEADRNVVPEMLVDAAGMTVPADTDMSPIVTLTQDKKWLIRHKALAALKICDTPDVRGVILHYLSQEDHRRYLYEISFVAGALATFGTAEDISLLEPLMQSRVLGVRSAAVDAADAIRLRVRGMDFSSMTRDFYRTMD